MNTVDKRNGFTDLVKFVMALLIMWGHYDYIIGQEYKSVTITKSLTEFAHNNVTVIVCIFFFISGYFAWEFSYEKLAHSPVGGVGSFIIKKVKRLYPKMVLSVIWFCTAGLIYRALYGHFWAGREIDLSNALLTALGINRWVLSAGGDINGPLWYVSVLMLCYCVFGLISSVKLSDDYKNVLFGLMVILGIISQLNDLTFPLLAGKVGRGYMCFFTGVCMALLLRTYPKLKNPFIAVVMIAVYTVAINITENYGIDILGNKNIAAIFTIAPAFIMLGETGIFKKLFNHKVFEWLGKISYPIYLYHIPTYLSFGIIFRDTVDYNSYIIIFIITAGVCALGCVAEKDWNIRGL